MEETSFRFTGDWHIGLALPLALLLAWAAWYLYWRETRKRADRLRWLLPTLRAVAVFLVVFVLAGPVLHHEKVIRQLGRLFVFVDGSQSMSLTDEEMPAERKVAAMQAVGMLPEDEAFEPAAKAASRLAKARQVAVKFDPEAEEEERVQAVARYVDLLEESFKEYRIFLRVSADGRGEGGGDDGFEKSLLERARKLEEMVLEEGEVEDQGGEKKENPFHDPFKVADEMVALDGISLEFKARLTREMAEYLSGKADDQGVADAVKEFDAMTRWQRAERLILDEEHGLLSQLAEKQDIELVTLREGEVENLWWQRRGGKKTSGEIPDKFVLAPNGRTTDLGDVLRSTLGKESEGVGVIVITDGQHNSTSSPLAVSRILGEGGVPMFTVGVGSEKPVYDMALSEVVGPSTVFKEDRVKGEILLNDLMEAGVPFDLKVLLDEEVVWEEKIEATGVGERRIPYDFSVTELVARLVEKGKQEGVEEGALKNLPLGFVVKVEAQREEDREKERIKDNNAKPMFVQAVAQKRRVLLIDSRPRWETRYLHNLFERDEKWEVNVLMRMAVSPDGPQPWDHGMEPGEFPDTEEELFSYDVVIMGDVPRRWFSEEEVGWLAAFAGERAGGLIFIDGTRGNLRTFLGTPLGDILPVNWFEDGKEEIPEKLVLAPEGELLNPLRFVPATEENAGVWESLRAPHWVAKTVVMPGAELLVEAEMKNGTRLPAMVWRRFGAGKVFYTASDQLWRWRYDVADRYHQRFWMQLVNWVAEPPFSVKGGRVSLGTDEFVYPEGGIAAFRARLRDEVGRPVNDADLVAVLIRDGEEIAEYELEADENGGGIYRGRSAEMGPGTYEIAVRQKRTFGGDINFEERVEIRVEEPPNHEMDALSMNQGLLEGMAKSSGGAFFLEEEAGALVGLLDSIDRKKVISSQTDLWSSYWWLVPVILLLTAEWILRKRAGML